MGQGAAIFGCSGPVLTKAEAAFFREADPLGFILFARNIEHPEQVHDLTRALRSSVGREAPVLIDQEGGRVARLRAPYWREWPTPLDQVASDGDTAERRMYMRYRIIADELRAIGIDANCAPVADIAHDDTHPVLKNRCYGTRPEIVTRIARAVADGLRDGAVLPVIKHMPGHGRANVDSHKDLPRVSTPAEILHDSDFAPFRALADLPMGMTAHQVFESLGETGPATTSASMIRLIREEIGFDGLLMTDDISMEALSGSVQDRSRAALAAGVDIILHCNGKAPEMAAVAAEAGRMTEAAQRRADSALALRRAPVSVDISELEAELRQAQQTERS